MRELTVNKQEMLRYLGHRGQTISEDLEEQIDRVIAECLSLAKPLTLWRDFPLGRDENGVLRAEGSALVLPGDSIAAHLEGAARCVVLAATLGIPLDMALRRYSLTDVTCSVLLDAAATALVETVCDDAEIEIRANLEASGFHLNFRFSPGYGDLPLDIQPVLLDTLQAGKRIGLSCTGTSIMTPRKSVTAILGVFPGDKTPNEKKKSCEACAARESCIFRKEGGGCGAVQADTTSNPSV